MTLFRFEFALTSVLFLSPLLTGCSENKAPGAVTAVAPAADVIRPVDPVSVKSAASEQKPVTEFVEPPALPPEIVRMVTTNTTASAELRIHAIANSSLTSVQKAQALLLVLPTVNQDGQRALAQAAVNYVDDSTYLLIRRPLIEGKQHPQVLSAFLTDTLKRTNRIKMPTLLELARAEAHPMQAEARQLLTMYFGQDQGTNWTEWERVMLAWLSRNP